MEALELNRISRRELLTLLLGGAAAAAACRRPRRSPRFEGRLLGQSHDRGHPLLRDGFRPTPVRRERIPVVIIGAGAAGLAAAWKLRRSGFGELAVLDLEDHPGGTSASGRNAVSAFPWGAHYVPVPLPGSRALTELLHDMDVFEGTDSNGVPRVREELLCAAPQERLYFAGAWQEGLYPRFGATADDLRQLAELNAEIDRWVGFRDASGRRAFTLPSASCGDHPELDALDGMSMDELMRRRRWTSPRLRWFVEYGCRDDYGGRLENTSAWAGLFYFAARTETPGGKAAEFITWPEGNGRLIDHLTRSAEGRLRLGTGAFALRPTTAGVEVRAYDFHTKEAFAIDAEHVVCAVPRYAALRLLSGSAEGLGAHRESVTYSSWVVANLTLDSRPDERGFPLAWDNVLYDSHGLGYVDATHQLGKDFGSTVWTYYLPLLDGTAAEQRQILLDASWEHWVDVILSDLSRAHPDLAERVRAIDVWRWGHAMVRPTVGLLRGSALQQARRPVGQIHFAHTDLSGMALFEEAQYWGVAAAEAILSRRGLPFRSSL